MGMKKYELSGAIDPCDRCGMQTKMHVVMESTDEGETFNEVHQYRNPRTKRDRDARYCEPCAKEVCDIFPAVSWPQARKAMEILGREKDADADIAELRKEATEAKTTVLRYLVQHDADQLTHGGHTAKFRVRANTGFDRDILQEFLTEEQFREATKTSESQFVQVY